MPIFVDWFRSLDFVGRGLKCTYLSDDILAGKCNGFRDNAFSERRTKLRKLLFSDNEKHVV